jgi:uncharacterized phiE125 gp8 family phage protein
MALASTGVTTISDSFDPQRPARQVPGGLVQSVDVSYDNDDDTAVSAREAENWLRTSSEEETVVSLLRGVQSRVEQEFGLALVPQTVTAVLAGPSREAELPRTPFKSLTSVKEIAEGSRQGDVSDEYYVLSGVLNRQTGAAISGRPIEVVYNAGYTDVPEDLKTAIKRIVTDHFDHRGDLPEGTVNEIPRNARSILRKYRD